MKRIIILSMMTVLIFTGCTTTTNSTKSIKPWGVKLVKLDYKVLGETSAKETRSYVFGVDFAHLFHDERAEMDSSPMFGSCDATIRHQPRCYHLSGLDAR